MKENLGQHSYSIANGRRRTRAVECGCAVVCVVIFVCLELYESSGTTCEN